MSRGILTMLIFAVLGTSWTARASHIVICEIEAEVVEVIPRLGQIHRTVSEDLESSEYLALLKLRILDTKKLPGSYVSCESWEGKDRHVLINDGEIAGMKQSRIQLRYEHSNHRIGSRTEWEIIPE